MMNTGISIVFNHYVCLGFVYEFISNQFTRMIFFIDRSIKGPLLRGLRFGSTKNQSHDCQTCIDIVCMCGLVDSISIER